MKRFRYDIIGVSEVRWTGKGETPQGDFIWSGEETSHIRGVGLLLSKQAQKALIGYNPISSRIILARFDAAPFKISVIHVYAPTSSSSEEEIESFYNHVEDALAKADKKDVIILTGDWNAKIGDDNRDWKSAMGKYGYGDRNERGERLLEFATLHNFFICNTRFQQKSNRKWTWASPDGIHKNMIDLILIQQRWKTSVVNCRTFQSADISSDHSLVLCNIKL
jgi:exonuclease III